LAEASLASASGFDSATFDFTIAPTAVPEPATWATMLLGFAGLAFAGYRKSRKSALLAA
jgi:PEP-CTERM motif